MPFNSLVFLLVFLPAALGLHELVARWRPGWRVPFLVALSLVFYGWWDWRLLPVLLLSVVANWLLAEAFLRTGQRAFLAVAIALDLLLLAGFKYLGFLADLADDLIPGLVLPIANPALPLGISFFTFQHIAYLVDLRRGAAARMGLLDYALYVAFLPRVIAGPLIRPAEFASQLPGARPNAEGIAAGLLLLTAGLAKKLFLGDTLGSYVDPMWAQVAAGTAPGFARSAEACLGYTLQLYFDFSGYTDMALGLAIMFGFVLPENFRTPYGATSIQDFWRRWHITLSFWLRDYLYIPLGGSRHGLGRQVGALCATMALGGLWHGAGLTFVAWGAAHGAALSLHLVWRKTGLALPDALGWAMTFAFVALAWVLFRAPDFDSALLVYRGLLGFNPDATPASLDFWTLAAIAGVLATTGPTAHEMVARVPRTTWAAVAASLLAAALILQIGDDANRSFIYANF